MTPEQLLAHQQLVINNRSSRLAAMEESVSAPSPTAHIFYRYKASNSTPFSGVPDTLRPSILQVDTHLHLASIGDPALQLLVTTQFLAPGPLTWVQTLDGVTTWTALKEQMVSYYQPLDEKLRARDSLHGLRQLGIVDEYAKALNELVIKVPQMTLEEKRYVFTKGLKHNVQVSVSLHSVAKCVTA
jgi:Retrotransposon gag protein